MSKNYCPFKNGDCQDSCVFYDDNLNPKCTILSAANAICYFRGTFEPENTLPKYLGDIRQHLGDIKSKIINR
jgi:hypothetical protein